MFYAYSFIEYWRFKARLHVVGCERVVYGCEDFKIVKKFEYLDVVFNSKIPWKLVSRVLY